MSGEPRWTPQMLDAYRRRIKSETGVQVATTPLDAPDVVPDATPYNAAECAAIPVAGWQGKQSQTEARYNRDVLGGRGRFEAITLRLPGGGRYTPDFLTLDDGVVTLHEVKGAYRLGSQGRAYTAFREAAAAYPMWRFVWAHWCGRAWQCKAIEPRKTPSARAEGGEIVDTTPDARTRHRAFKAPFGRLCANTYPR